MSSFNFSYESIIPALASDVFSYHARDLAILRLTPPWEAVKLLNKTGGIEPGAKVELHIRLGLVNTIWQAERVGFSNNRQLVDIQRKGPFRFWKHTQSFRSLSDNTTSLRNNIQFSLPFWKLANNRLGSYLARKRLERIFTYRHSVIQNDLRHWNDLKSYSKPSVVITGGNGLIGRELGVFLKAQGHAVTILSRSGKSSLWGVPAVKWDPQSKMADWEKLDGIDCWIHLAGENFVAGRWTTQRMKSLRSSRVEVTRFLVDGFKKMPNPPKVFVGSSGVGFYGDAADRELSEEGPKGTGFLADLCEAWENASADLDAMGIRRVIFRIGMVLTPKGGALAKMMPVYKAGLGGRQGRGTQYWSWIAMDDLLRVFHTALVNPQYRGIYNAVSPIPLQNREFSNELADKLNRPGVSVVPGWILRCMLGKMADEALLTSQRVVPQQLIQSGFQFDFPVLDLALSHLLGKH